MSRFVLRRLSSRDPLLELHQGLASMLNGTARVLGVRHRVSVERIGEAPTPPPPPPVPERRLQSALRYMTQEDIEAYVSRLVSSKRLEGLALQNGAERFIYSHCVKILLCVMHEALDNLTGATIFGLRVALFDQTPRAKLDLLGALERRLDDGCSPVNVDVDAVCAFVDGVVEVEREKGRAIFGAYPQLEAALHHNVSVLVLNLIADACSTFRFDFFGHSLRLAVDPNDTFRHVSLDTLRSHRDAKRAVFDQTFVDALTEEIISDKDINMWLLPDSLERNFYRRFFSFYGVLLDYALCEMRLSLLDVDARVRFDRTPDSSLSE